MLKSNVTLYIEAGATLLGSRYMDDYPDITPQLHYLYSPRFTKYMIYAEKAENIGIAGLSKDELSERLQNGFG